MIMDYMEHKENFIFITCQNVPVYLLILFLLPSAVRKLGLSTHF